MSVALREISESSTNQSPTSSTHSLGRTLFFNRYPCNAATYDNVGSMGRDPDSKWGLTLSSPSGMASAKRFASSAISTSSSTGMACATALRFGRGRFCCDTSIFSSDVAPVDDEPEAAGLEGKKHLKMPSACHFVACVKFTHTSIRPGRLSAGSRRSMWLVVANSKLEIKGCEY